jgi:hypothetical protein
MMVTHKSLTRSIKTGTKVKVKYIVTVGKCKRLTYFPGTVMSIGKKPDTYKIKFSKGSPRNVPRVDIVLFKERKCIKRIFPEYLKSQNLKNKARNAGLSSNHSRKYVTKTHGTTQNGSVETTQLQVERQSYVLEGHKYHDENCEWIDLTVETPLASGAGGRRDMMHESEKEERDGGGKGNQAIISTACYDSTGMESSSPEFKARPDPPEQGQWAAVPFLNVDTKQRSIEQGLVTGRGKLPDSLKVQFPDKSVWTVRKKNLSLSKRKPACADHGGAGHEEEATLSGRESNRLNTPVTPSLSQARASGWALAGGIERNGWGAMLSQRGIMEVSDPRWGTYGKRASYHNHDALINKDLLWWMWNKPRGDSEEGAGKSLYDGEYCERCGEGKVGDSDNLMVCEAAEGQDGPTCVDGRTRAFHCPCLPRPITQPPEGHWVCHLCRPQVGRPEPTSPARVLRDEATEHVHHLFGISIPDGASPASTRFCFRRSDLPKDYRLGLVIGPSGSGKTTALLELTDPAPGGDPGPNSRARALQRASAVCTGVAGEQNGCWGSTGAARAARPSCQRHWNLTFFAGPQLSHGSLEWRSCRKSRPNRGWAGPTTRCGS